MSKWIVECHTVYLNGMEDTTYYSGNLLGFCVMGKRKDAKLFDTKRKATDFIRSKGKSKCKTYKAIKVEE